MSNDTIAMMITCVRNASVNKAKLVEVPATHTTRSIAAILLQEGFIYSCRERQHGTLRLIVVTLRYQGPRRTPCITTLRRISKPGLRVYASCQQIPKVLSGEGMVILSTSQGIMMDREARQRRVGGEVICYVW